MNNNNMNVQQNEDEAPPAFTFDIPMMDESLLDNHLQVPNENDGGNTTDNEGGEEGGGGMIMSYTRINVQGYMICIS